MSETKPAGRKAVTMTEEEVQAFLGANLKLQVATVGKDGAPHLTTLFYVVQDGLVAFWTYGSSQKVRNLERDPRITVLVETGDDYAKLAGVSIHGTAELVRDPDGIRRIGSAVVTAMAGGADLGDLGAEIVEKQVAKRVGIVVRPHKVASWDHSKMSALPGMG